MPPGWGASGRRILLPVAVRLGEGGAVEPLAVGAFVPMTVTGGSWQLEGDALKFDLQMSGGAPGFRGYQVRGSGHKSSRV
jgi:hypothetical protein